MPTQCKVAAIGNNHSLLDFQADVAVDVNSGRKVDGIIYDFRVQWWINYV